MLDFIRILRLIREYGPKVRLLYELVVNELPIPERWKAVAERVKKFMETAGGLLEAILNRFFPPTAVYGGCCDDPKANVAAIHEALEAPAVEGPEDDKFSECLDQCEEEFEE